MKKVLFSLTFLSVFLSFSQKTIQFSDPLPTGSTSIIVVNKSQFGAYKNTETGVTYRIDEKGISIETVVIGSVTREQVRESSKLKVRGDYLLGIKDNDSVPCVLEGERYYYGIVQNLPVIGEGSLNALTQITSNQYIINFHEGNYFEPSILTFEKGKITISHGELNYQSAMDGILKVATITRYGSAVTILAPTFEQWERLRKLIFTGETITYVKQ